MANVKENAALKSRQTKLLKKSKEELIEIVLKKDKIEKNQVNQISNLKGEINSLNSEIKGFIALRNDYSKLEDVNKTLHETIDSRAIEWEETSNRLNKHIIETENKAKARANIAIILGIAFIIAFIIAIISFICK